MLCHPVSPILATLINESFSSGIFPDKLKNAKVITLHKKGLTDNPSSYRPISLLSIFSKIFEKVMHKRLYEFLEKIIFCIHYNLVLEVNTPLLTH